MTTPDPEAAAGERNDIPRLSAEPSSGCGLSTRIGGRQLSAAPSSTVELVIVVEVTSDGTVDGVAVMEADVVVESVSGAVRAEVSPGTSADSSLDPQPMSNNDTKINADTKRAECCDLEGKRTMIFL
ncbi:MAG: hypothetical protein WBM50_24520 [Acidimicrobiales bacterium]